MTVDHAFLAIRNTIFRGSRESNATVTYLLTYFASETATIFVFLFRGCCMSQVGGPRPEGSGCIGQGRAHATVNL